MQTYVWGVLILAFLLDVLRYNIDRGGGGEKITKDSNYNTNQESENIINDTENIENQYSKSNSDSGMKIKLDGNQDLKVQYEGENVEQIQNLNNLENLNINNNSYNKINLKILYCTS